MKTLAPIKHQGERMALELTFLDSLPTIIRAIKRTQRKFGGDFEDLLDRSTELFLYAYYDHDDDITNFLAFLYSRLVFRLHDDAKAILNRRCQIRTNVFDQRGRNGQVHPVFEEDKPKSDFNLELFLLDLSPDAQLVVRKLFNPGMALQRMIQRANFRNYSIYRAVLKDYFRGRGWTVKRFNIVWKEIKQLIIKYENETEKT